MEANNADLQFRVIREWKLRHAWYEVEVTNDLENWIVSTQSRTSYVKISQGPLMVDENLLCVLSLMATRTT